MSNKDVTSTTDTDRAPIVYLTDGTSVKAHIIGATCEGDISGEVHYWFYPKDMNGEDPTLYFEGVPSAECVHCGDEIAQALISDYHNHEHPTERWNPSFYPEVFGNV